MKKVLRLLSTAMMVVMLVPLATPLTASAAAADTPDATFFGYFDYDAYPGLADVKAAVDAGDYTSAKAELLEYYRNIISSGERKAFEITEKDANLGLANLARDNILTGPYEFDVQIGMITVQGNGTENAAWYEADITDKVKQEYNNQNISVMLFEREKQEYAIVVASREDSEHSPVLEVKMEGSNDPIVIQPDKDTYVGTENQSANYGTSKTLLVREQSDSLTSPFGIKTARAYINFPLSSIPQEGKIESAILKVYAYVDGTEEPRSMHIISVGDTTWGETDLKWSGINGNIYSWQNAPAPVWEKPSGSDSEYLNVISRFWFARPMVWEYKKYLADPEGYPEGKEYGEKLLALMNAFTTQKGGGFNRTLETGERINRWTDVIYNMIDTEAMTPEYFTNFLKMIYADCDSLYSKDIKDGSVWWSNWRMVANAGFYKGTVFCREFKNYSNWYNKCVSNIDYTIDILFNDDMSFTEAGPAYAAWVTDLLADVAIMGDINGTPVPRVFLEKLRAMTRFSMESYFPDGYDSNIGDSNYKNQMRIFERVANFLGDPVITHYVTGGKEGFADYTSSYYADGNFAMMRSSWDPDETVYVNYQTNAADGHAHPDSNQVLLYAYGSPLIVDSGRYGYSGSTLYSKVRTAQAHNTVEVSGVNLGNHSAAGKPFSYWSTNGAFDFAESSQTGYPSTVHTRSVLFLKDEGFVIVSDKLDYTGSASAQTYKQNWHFMPNSRAEISGNNVKTNFYNKANIIVSSTTAPEINDGYFSADYGLAAASKYASYTKVAKNAKFDTVLYPIKANDTTTAVETTDLAEEDLDYSSVKITINGKDSYYYNARSIATRDFGPYSYDGKMAYVSGGKVTIAGGKTLKANGTDLVVSPTKIKDLQYVLDGTALSITGSKLVPSNDKSEAIKIYAPSVETVTVNGEAAQFTKDGDYIYAVKDTSDFLSTVVADIKTSNAAYNKVGENLIPNPGFEEGTTGWTTNAYQTPIVDGQNGFSLVKDVKTEGNQALKITANVGSGGLGSLSTRWPVTPGKTYYLAFDVIHTAQWGHVGMFNSALTRLRTLGGEGPEGTWGAEKFPSTDTWKRMAYVFTLSDQECYVGVALGWCGAGAYVDNFELYELEKVAGVETTVRVNFIGPDGSALRDPITKAGKEGAYYFASDFAETIVDGTDVYVIDYDRSTISKRLAEGENVVNLYYNLSEATVRINFLDDNGGAVQDSVLLPATVGQTFEYKDFDEGIYVNGIFYIYSPSRSTKGIVIGPGLNEYNIRYTASYSELAPTDDMSIRTDNNLEGNDGTGTSKSISRLVVAQNAFYQRKSFVKFDVSQIDLGKVEKALLRLKVAETANGASLVSVYDTTTDWSEDSVPPYESAPARGNLIGSFSVALADVGKIITFDMTDYLKSKQGAGYIAITMDDLDAPSGSNNIVHFYSKDSTEPGMLPPALYVCLAQEEEIKPIELTVEAGKVSAQGDLGEELKGGTYTAVLAVYDESGRMTNVKTAVVTDSVALEITGNLPERYSAKFFILSDLKTIRPVSTAISKEFGGQGTQ